MKKIVYLDVCALCRPFDDQSYIRIKMETDAVNLILSKIREGEYRLAVSVVHIKEIEAISNHLEKLQLLSILDKYGIDKRVNLKNVRKRSEELFNKYKFGVADAAHVAFAEALEADFISCNDRLLKKCKKCNIEIWCGNPIDFCLKEDLK